jgi:hypothetical protein
MSIERAYAPARPPETAQAGIADAVPGSIAVELAPPPRQVDDLVVEAVAHLAPGKALQVGGDAAEVGIWLATRGWIVTLVDGSAEVVDRAREAAAAEDVTLAFIVADPRSWQPASRFDLVVALYSVPARGAGRSRMLETAVEAVAPGGTIVISELDIALDRAGRMAEKHLVSVDELERYLDGFRITRSATRLVSRPHGFEEVVVPVAHVVATRRTDLRTF